MTPHDPVVETRPTITRPATLAERLSLERNVLAVSGASFLMTFGEELWKRFVPKFLEALGAPVTAIGLYGTTRDVLDGVYQYPGGWLADRVGRRRALRLFIVMAALGYAIYALTPGWPPVFVGLALVMAWTSMASPALFAVIGDALPKGRRAMGFTIQSILRRVPIMIAPVVGGLVVASVGVERGVRRLLLVTLALAAVTFVVASRVNVAVIAQPTPTRIAGVWRSLPGALRRLLASDIVVRICEGMVDVLVVLYATNVVGVTLPQFGVLVSLQMATSIAVYFPAAALADRIGRKPLVTATFAAFALFPLAVTLAESFTGLVVAFVIGGLREIGEPARKAMIVDLAEPGLRARSVGLYYLVRSLAIAPAGVAGGLLWRVAPALPFRVAAAIGLAGTVLFVLTVKEEHAA